MTGLEKAIEKVEKALTSTNSHGFNVCDPGYWHGLTDALDILKEEVEKEILAKRLPDGLYNKT